MTVRWVFWIVPVLFIYSNRLVSKGALATNWVLFIAVRPFHKNSTGIAAHELEHSRQILQVGALAFLILLAAGAWWQAAIFPALVTHHVLYTISKPYRYLSELNAYRRQLEHSRSVKDQSRYRYAEAIANDYKLSVSMDTAEKELERPARAFFLT